MKPISIRPYEASDYDELCLIHDAARKIELSLASLDDAFLPFSIASEREDFFEYPYIDVAIMDGKIVAFSAYTEEELAWLYVSADKVRQKIGTAMVERALQKAPDINAIEVLVGNEPAKKLYESCGFSVHHIAEGVMPGNEKFPVRVYCMARR
ncbi:MAG: GNAT family N-acetyltransferase [Clostridiales bacterium]|nr:GNAT family N-acetyltransferase [Clostridiales bacterium]